MRALVLGLLASFLPSQQDPTPEPLALAKVFGIARSHDGTPWPRAAIHLFEAAHANNGADVDPGELDQRTATTDDRGRFALDVLAGCSYAGWAETNAEGGKVLFSPVVIDIRPGTKVEFTADAEPRGARSFELDLGSAETIDGVKLLAHANRSRIPVALTMDHVGVVTIPPIPSDQLEIDLLDAAGNWIAQTHLDAEQAPKVLRVPAKCQKRVRVLGATDKKPIAKARIVCFRRGIPCELGLTDEHGEASVIVPVHASFDVSDEKPTPVSPWTVVLAPGLNAGGLLIRDAGVDVGPQEVMPEGIDGICRIAESGRAHPKVSLAIDGKPLAGACVHVNFSASHQINENSSMGFGCNMVIRSTADGGTDLSFVETSAPMLSVMLRIDDALRSQLPASWSAQLPSWIPLWIDGNSEKPIVVDLLRDLIPVEFRLLRADDHSPAANTRLLTGVRELSQDRPLFTDRLGRARLPLPRKGPAIRVGALEEAGWCAVEVDAGALDRPGVEPIATLTMRRSIPVTIAAQVPDGTKKLENLWGYLGNNQGQGFVIVNGRQVGTVVESDPRPAQLVRVLADSEVSGMLVAGYRGMEFTGRTATAFVPDLAARYQLNLGANVDGAWSNGTVQIEVEGKEETIPVVVSLGGN